MNIAFFCSNHGYGHILREKPVIDELASRGHQIFVVCGKAQCDQLDDHANIHKVPYDTDVGIIVKLGTLMLDKEKTTFALKKYMHEYPDRILFAKELLAKQSIERVIVDIVPWAIDAASECGVESYLMTSFTWIEQYKGFVEDEILVRLKSSFMKANHILYYALANDRVREMLPQGEDVGFVCRKFDSKRIQQIRREHQRKCVFLSLGVSNSGLDFDIDVSGLPYDFICTDAYQLKGDNVTYLSKDTRDIHNYIAAAEYCISKPGWTTIAEMMVAGVKFALIERPDVPEDSMTILMLKQMNAAMCVRVEELKDIGNVLNGLNEVDLDIKKYANNYEYVADLVTK